MSDIYQEIISFMIINNICSEACATQVVKELKENGLISEKTEPARIAYSWLEMTRAMQGVRSAFFETPPRAYEYNKDSDYDT